MVGLTDRLDMTIVVDGDVKPEINQPTYLQTSKKFTTCKRIKTINTITLESYVRCKPPQILHKIEHVLTAFILWNGCIYSVWLEYMFFFSVYICAKNRHKYGEIVENKRFLHFDNFQHILQSTSEYKCHTDNGILVHACYIAHHKIM